MQAENIFLSALENSLPRERNAYLDGACGSDAVLRAEVEALLHSHQEAGSFLDGPLFEPGVTTDRLHSEQCGAQIGPYKLLQRIGEGGFGVVFMADQTTPVRRRVAVKVIKPGMDTRQVIARFEAERQALALMDHPHIARVLDAGATDSGLPYFVMELVRGVPITEFCDRNKVSVRQRLELFVSVAQAIQHAHQKGVIHRDIKPSNVLVTLHDGVPVAKVIDFGIAKAAGQQLTDKTLFTNFAQMIGTPLYMSPEQAEMSGLDVDTRSDIYSLGVLLYELLTGTTPFDKERIKKAGYDEIRRIIREDEPDRPSARVSTLGEAAATVSANRGSDPSRLRRLIRGELDWVVMKALEKDRNRRYDTVSALVADVQRYLCDETVHACPPSAWYRFRKLARRNKAALVTSVAVIAAVVVALVSLGAAVRVLSATNARIKGEQQQTGAALGRAKQANESLTRSLAREERAAYAQRIALAERELAAHNVGRAEELLDQCPVHLRGWEWHFLKRQRYGMPAPLQHPNTVHRVVYSPDGRQIATGCLDGKVRIWDMRTGQVLHELSRDNARHPAVRVLVFSRDRRLLAVGYHDGDIRVWDAATGEPLAALAGHREMVWQIAFSPDSQSLASAGQDGTVRLWALGARDQGDADRRMRFIAQKLAPVKGVAFSATGDQLLAACRDGTIKTWDLASGQEVSSFKHQIQYVDNVCFSPDTRRIAWSCQDGVVKVWDIASQREEFAIQSNTGFGRGIAFSPDSRRIAIAGFDGTVRLVDGATGQETLTIYAHTSLVSGVAYSPDGHRIASASYDYTLRTWDATPLASDPLGPHCVKLTGHTEQVYGVDYSADGRWLASASMDGTVKVWECGAQVALRYTLRGHKGDVIGVVFSPDCQTLASGSWDGTVKLWDMGAPVGDSLTERGTIRLAERVTSLGFSPDGLLLAVGQPNGIAMFDPLSRKEVLPFKRTMTPVPALVFSPDSRRLITAGATDPTVRIWDVAGDEPALKITHYSNPNSALDISPDGRLIATPGRQQDSNGPPSVKLWDAQTGELQRTLTGHEGYIWRVAFSPDGRYLASGSWDSTIKIWDLAAPDSAQPVTLRGHAGFIRSLAFRADGRRLASASGYSGHGEVMIWDAALWESR